LSADAILTNTVPPPQHGFALHLSNVILLVGVTVGVTVNVGVTDGDVPGQGCMFKHVGQSGNNWLM